MWWDHEQSLLEKFAVNPTTKFTHISQVEVGATSVKRF